MKQFPDKKTTCWGERRPLSLNLDGEDLDGHVFVHHLGLPHGAEAPPGFHLQQLQRLETQQGGGRRRSRILEDTDRRVRLEF